MRKQLTRQMLERILQAQNLEKLSVEQLTQLVLEDESIARFAPDGVCQTDPRSGDRIVFSSVRARRPHDNQPPAGGPVSQENDCIICQGKTTGIIDTADLSEGFTFINKNLFPVFYPPHDDSMSEAVWSAAEGCSVSGMHFLQWTSSLHDMDWYNMPLADRVIAMQRLAALEKKLLSGGDAYVSIIKNYGRLVGGSLAHGHQQIGVSDVMPNRVLQNLQFQVENGETFPAYMLRENPPELLIRDYGPAVLVTPYYMRRPYDMLLLFRDTGKSTLHSLNDDELEAAADGWRDAIRIMLAVMPQIGRETAYNIVTHNGPGAGLYFEFLPYTQEMGGFEHLGLYLCQGNPQAAASFAQQLLTDFEEKR